MNTITCPTITCPQCKHQIDISDAIKRYAHECDKEHDETITREAIERGRAEALSDMQAKMNVNEAAMAASRNRELEALQEVERLKGEQANVDLEVQKKVNERIGLIEQQAKERAEERYSDIQSMLEAKEAAMTASRTRELVALKEVERLKEAQANVDLEVQRKLNEKIGAIEHQAMERAEQNSSLKIVDLEKENADMLKQLDEAKRKGSQDSVQLVQATEELRLQLQAKDAALAEANSDRLQSAQEIEQLKQDKLNAELKAQKIVNERMGSIEQQANERAEERYSLQLEEERKKNADILKQLDEAKRKGSQGSVQLQGEVLELRHERMLRETFGEPSGGDRIVPILKGKNGADIAQHVITDRGKACGIILHETKRTSKWEKQWVEKFQGDMEKAGACIGIIVTETMPPNVKKFGQLTNRVWVSDIDSAVLVTGLLRVVLQEVEVARGHREGIKTNAEAIYEYVTGVEFAHRVRRVMEVLINFNLQNEKDYKAALTRYNKLRKQVLKGIESLTGIRGEIEGISDKELPPEIEPLELAESDEEEAA